MSLATADKWCTPFAQDAAKKIASLYDVYCGPAAVAWIAAVWNDSHDQPYDFMKRLRSKSLFPNGPRTFHNDIPGFQTNLSDLLRRETNNGLMLGPDIYFNFKSVHARLKSNAMPIIIRMPAPTLKGGLHYVTLYRSEKTEGREPVFGWYWQDNGVYRSSQKIGAGLSKSRNRKPAFDFFPWGAKQVMEVQ